MLFKKRICVAEHGNGDVAYAVLKKDEGWKDSLLNEDNYIVKGYARDAKTAKTTGAKSAVEKLREACACCNKAVLTVDAGDRKEVMEMLQVEHHRVPSVCPAAALERVERWMENVNKNIPEQCDKCGIKLCGLIVTQCGHLVCPECLIESVGGIDELKTARGIQCPVCDRAQEVKTFAYMQPGFSVAMQAVDGYNLDMDNWWLIQNNPSAHAKGMYVINHINNCEEAKKPYKAIIFSQFKTALYTIGDKLVRRALQKYNKDDVAAMALGDAPLLGGATGAGAGGVKKTNNQKMFESTNVKGYLAVADYQYPDQAIRDAELARFQTDPSCNILLLGQAHIDGLDLSFATDIFLLDEVWDQAKWMQLVARAYRIGATQSVKVWRLIGRGTIEEEMSEINQAASENDGSQFTPKEIVYKLLKKVAFIRTGQEAPRASNDDGDGDHGDGDGGSNAGAGAALAVVDEGAEMMAVDGDNDDSDDDDDKTESISGSKKTALSV